MILQAFFYGFTYVDAWMFGFLKQHLQMPATDSIQK
jgi:hypothetical protein